MSMKRYYECKAEGICVRCRRNKAVEGKTLCKACAGKVAVYYKSYYECTKERQNMHSKNNYEKKKAAGLCTDCMRKLPEGNKTVRCPECAKKRNEYYRRYYWRKNHAKSAYGIF